MRAGRSCAQSPKEKERGGSLPFLLSFLLPPASSALRLSPRWKALREEAGYEFILRRDEVINARHLLSSARLPDEKRQHKEHCSTSRRATDVSETHDATLL